ncbi:hypothetical protein E2562_027781 [Oryza meyeriana var. granulata]|uniref:t-SNARE coiled-coil homology domain-containing protein n=1 Tax=Oryza meyeriana var. granulata TaxID=110450 RepID=A0A6G1ECP1_9ORYZ|nr:hypothetical protein E2562_027781 [Oryza meyeriana var. granulata]
MSFQDLLCDMEAGVLQPAPPPTQKVAQGVFQLNTKVAALRYMADALGTPKETPSLRGRLSGTRWGITRLARSTNNNGDQRFADQKQTQLAVLPTQQDIIVLDNEIEFHEAVIAEREQGILEVQQEIADIHEIFRDLAVLVHDQGECIEIVTSNIDMTEAATSQAEVQLSKAAGIHEEEKEQLMNDAGTEDKSSTKCLLLAVIGLFMFIVGLVFVS